MPGMERTLSWLAQISPAIHVDLCQPGLLMSGLERAIKASALAVQWPARGMEDSEEYNRRLGIVFPPKELPNNLPFTNSIF